MYDDCKLILTGDLRFPLNPEVCGVRDMQYMDGSKPTEILMTVDLWNPALFSPFKQPTRMYVLPMEKSEVEIRNPGSCGKKKKKKELLP